MKSKKILISFLALAVVAAGGFFVLSQKNQNPISSNQVAQNEVSESCQGCDEPAGVSGPPESYSTKYGSLSLDGFKEKEILPENITEFVVSNKDVLNELTGDGDALVKKKEIPGTQSVAVEFKDSQSAQDFIKKADEANADLKIEKDVEVRVMASFNDPYYPSQYNLASMQMNPAWDNLSDVSDKKIAIVDTGVRSTHDELASRVLTGFNILTGVYIEPGTNSDDNGHGTAMASAAAAAANNSKGLVGVAYNANIIPIKALNGGGFGSASDVAIGIRFAKDSGADVINLSLGASSFSQTMHDAIAYAVSGGSTVIAAAGNDNGGLSYPGSDSLCLTVGSVGASNVRSDFSNYGAELDVMAPGESVYAASYLGDSSYVAVTGTSVSTAEVSGLTALAQKWHSGYSYSQIPELVRQSAQKLSGMGGYSRTDFYGYGLVSYANLQGSVGSLRHSFVSQNTYPSLAPGDMNAFQVIVKNEGSSSWARGQVNLGTAREHDRITSFTREGNGPSGWISPNRIRFEQTRVAPGQTATFTFWMRNDGLSSGTYREYFQLVADGIGWMEDYGIYWDVTAQGQMDKYKHEFVSEGAYPTLGQGESANLWVKVRNTGSVTWTKDWVNLGTARGHDRITPFTREGENPSGWISPNRVRFEEALVAPGQIATFSFWIRNDGVSPGTYQEYFQLVADGIGWMEDYGIYWDVYAH